MSYDYTGIRVKKSGTSGLTYFPFTGYEVQGGQVTKYIKLDNEIIASRRGASRLFYHNDHLGGVNLISDLNGLQVQLNEYDSWGKVSRSEGNTEPTHRFTGQELDPESGIHYYGGRYYDQNLGRFISPDPFIQEPGDPQNLNRYAYVLNNPQGYIDPSGNFWSFFDDPSGSEWRAISSDFRGDMAGGDYPAFSCMSGCAGSSQAGSVFTSTGWSGSWSGSGLSSAASAGLNLASSYGILTWAAGGACAASVWCGVGAAGVAAVGVYNAYDDLSGRGGQASSFERTLQSIPGVGSNSSAFIAAAIGAIGAPGKAGTKAVIGVLPTPLVTNQKLQNIINNLYKGTINPNRVGTGTTADAIVNELATNMPTGGTFHFTKGKESIAALEHWLKRNSGAPYRDRLVAQSLLDELRGAFGGVIP